MGLSIRAYARHRGVSDAAVRKAIATGRITPQADGTLEVERTDREWARNTAAPRNGTPVSGHGGMDTIAVPASDALCTRAVRCGRDRFAANPGWRARW